MSPLRVLSLALVAGLLLGPKTARGDAIEEARIHYKAGESYYKSADYLNAIKEFNESYRLSKRGLLLYNIGLCEEKLGDFKSAIATLRTYLAVPESEKDRPQVEDKLKKLGRAQQEKEARAAAGLPPPPEVPAPAEAVPRSYRGYGVAVGGGAVALLASSLVTGVLAHGHYGNLEQRCGAGGSLCPADFAAERDLGRSLALTADVLLVAGVAAAVVATVLLVVKRSPARVAIVPAMLPSGALVSF